MADNTVLNAGAGGDTIATDDIGGTKHQLVKVEFGAADTATPVSTSNPFPVSDAGGSLTVDAPVATPVFVRLSDGTSAIATLPVSAAALPLPAGAATAAKQPALGTAGAASADVITVQGVASMTALKTDASATTQPVSAASLPLPTGASTAVKQPALGTAGAASADVLSVQGVASMTALKVDGSGVTQPVSGTVTANLGTAAVTNAGTFAVQIAANSSVNQAQIAGTATDTNSGNKSPGTQRVVLATDQPALTNALKVDGSAVTQPVSGTVTSNLAASAGAAGLSKFHLVSAGSTNATNVKASAGKLHGWYIYNSNAAARKVAFHNTAGAPTAGTGVTDSFVIPPTSAANEFTETGIAFSTGIAITTVTDLTDAGATAVAASDLVINLYYI